MTVFVKPTPAETSAMLRALTAPSRVVDGILFRLYEEQEGDVWSDLVDRDDDVWNRRDPADRAAWDVPRAETESFDVALSRKVKGVRLVSLSEQEAGASHPWRCELSIAPLRAEPFVGLGANPAIALQDANFQLHGFLVG